MSRRFGRTAEAAVAVFVVALLLGQVLGQPVLLGYVRTGSMEPTLQPGDGFVAVPTPLVGPSVGDVVVYRAERVNGGGLTTHRIVGETARGYVTQGDANPFTDQSGGEPPVRRAQIVAVALDVGGHVLVVPGLGSVAERSQQGLDGLFDGVPRELLVGVAVAGLLVLLAGGAAAGRRDRTPLGNRERGHRRGRRGLTRRDVVLGCGLLLIAAATASALVPLGPTEYRVVSAQSDVPGPRVIEAGTTETTTYRVPGGALVPTWYRVEPASEGVTVTNGTGVVARGDAANVSVTLSAPPSVGSYRRYVDEHRYPLVLPLPVVRGLAGLHPLAPVFVVDLALAVPLLVVARTFSSTARQRNPPGTRSLRERVVGRRRR